MILGIDTSLGTAVAVIEPDGVVRSQGESRDPRGHAEVIGSLIESALAEASARAADITHVAAGMGPGPFTGLRVGIAAARAFALGRGIPIIPVVSHDAAALVFSSPRLLSVEELARTILGRALVRRPAEITLPAHRGWLAKLTNAFPSLAFYLGPIYSHRGRHRQSRLKSAPK